MCQNIIQILSVINHAQYCNESLKICFIFGTYKYRYERQLCLLAVQDNKPSIKMYIKKSNRIIKSTIKVIVLLEPLLELELERKKKYIPHYFYLWFICF